MKSLKEVESWSVVSKKAYWDREVSLEKWKTRVAQAHRSYFPDAIAKFHAIEFIYFYGKSDYVTDWPKLRAQLPSSHQKYLGMYDLHWSQLAGGGWNLRPSLSYLDLSKRRKEFLLAISKTPGKSIYEIAKELHMQYRRAHDHAKDLMEKRLIRGQSVIETGHRKTKLFPAYGGAMSLENLHF
jgi:hypothetical protein